jgi:hypothetical protein
VFDLEDYRPVIEYTYEVDGVTYIGSTIVSGLITFNWKGPATRLIKRFPVEARVPVFVDPANPRRAALQPGMDKNLPVILICVIGFLLLLVCVAIFEVRK